MKILPALEEFKEYLSYDPETGLFTWIKLTGKKSMKVGVIAGHEKKKGCHRSHGYVYILFRRKQYAAHRLAWLFTHGFWPKEEVDHINGIKNDNRISNLRDVSKFINQQNRPCHRAGRLVGATFSKEKNKWRAQTSVNGKQTHVGYFDSELEAHKAFLKRRAEDLERRDKTKQSHVSTVVK